MALQGCSIPPELALRLPRPSRLQLRQPAIEVAAVLQRCRQGAGAGGGGGQAGRAQERRVSKLLALGQHPRNASTEAQSAAGAAAVQKATAAAAPTCRVTSSNEVPEKLDSAPSVEPGDSGVSGSGSGVASGVAKAPLPPVPAASCLGMGRWLQEELMTSIAFCWSSVSTALCSHTLACAARGGAGQSRRVAGVAGKGGGSGGSCRWAQQVNCAAPRGAPARCDTGTLPHRVYRGSFEGPGAHAPRCNFWLRRPRAAPCAGPGARSPLRPCVPQPAITLQRGPGLSVAPCHVFG